MILVINIEKISRFARNDTVLGLFKNSSLIINLLFQNLFPVFNFSVTITLLAAVLEISCFQIYSSLAQQFFSISISTVTSVSVSSRTYVSYLKDISTLSDPSLRSRSHAVVNNISILQEPMTHKSV